MIDFTKSFELGEKSANYVAIVVHDDGDENTNRDVFVRYDGINDAWFKLDNMGNKCFATPVVYTGELNNFTYRIRIDNAQKQVNLQGVSVRWRR